MASAEVTAPIMMAICCRFGRGADQEAGLEVLARGAGVARGDRDDGGDA